MNGRFTVEFVRGPVGAVCSGFGRVMAGAAVCCGGTTSLDGSPGFAGGGSTGPCVDAACGFLTKMEVSSFLALVELSQTAREQHAPNADNCAIFFQRYITGNSSI